MMIPGEVTVIPNFLTVSNLGWVNNYLGLIVPWTASVFYIFMLRQFFMGIPNELFDAALIDGCGHLRFLIQIVLPLSKAALVTVVLFSFIGSWNAFLWPLIAINSDKMRTVAIEVYFLGGKTTGSAELGMVLVGAVLCTIPVLIIYLIFQRQIVGSLGHLTMKG